MEKLACLGILSLLLTSCLTPDGENWKRRWNEDTTALAAELKLAAQKIADLGIENVKLQTENAALRNELMELRKAANGVK